MAESDLDRLIDELTALHGTTGDEAPAADEPVAASDTQAGDETPGRTTLVGADTSLLEIQLETGRQGQIRAQAQLHGHALVGDRRYRPREGDPGHGVSFPRQALHAQRLIIVHPTDGRRIELTAPMPDDLRLLLDKLRRQARQG